MTNSSYIVMESRCRCECRDDDVVSLDDPRIQWTRAPGHEIGLQELAATTIEIHLTRLQPDNWLFHLLLKIVGSRDRETVTLSALGHGRTKREARQKTEWWLQKLREARKDYRP